MSFEVIMPALGMAQDTGHLVSWAKSVGDAVAEDDVLMEVETDKTTMEVPAGHSGYVAELRASAGDDVPVGDVIAIITLDKPTGVAVSSPPKNTSAKAKAVEAQADEDKIGEIESGDIEIDEVDIVTPVVQPIVQPIVTVSTHAEKNNAATFAADDVFASGSDRIFASPKLKRLAHEAGHKLSRLAEIGSQQPFHVSDLEQLLKLPTVPVVQGEMQNYGPAVSQIEAKVPTAGLDSFITRMQEEADIAVTQMSLWLSFASSSLRNCLKINDTAIDVTDTTGRVTASYMNPDLVGLNGQMQLDATGAPDLIVRDFSNGYITKAYSGIHAQPELSINRIGDNFEICLSYRETTMDANLAIQFVDEFCKKLSNPWMGLI